MQSLDSQEITGLFTRVADSFGGLDWCCILNGATGASAGDGPLVELAEDSWRRCLEVHLTGSWMLPQPEAIQFYLPGLAARPYARVGDRRERFQASLELPKRQKLKDIIIRHANRF